MKRNNYSLFAKSIFRLSIVLGIISTFIVSLSCQQYEIVDKKSSYSEWYLVPKNAKYLKIEMIDSLTHKPVENRLYFLSSYRGEKQYVDICLAELNLDENVMNFFPLPRNHAYVDIVKDCSLFPPLWSRRLNVYAEYKGNIGYFDFKTYSDLDSLLYYKQVIIDFDKRKGLLIDTSSDVCHRIWH